MTSHELADLLLLHDDLELHVNGEPIGPYYLLEERDCGYRVLLLWSNEEPPAVFRMMLVCTFGFFREEIMLSLTRGLKETIVTDGPCRITVVDVRGQKVRLAIDAERSVTVDRLEVHEAKMRGESPKALGIGR